MRISIDHFLSVQGPDQKAIVDEWMQKSEKGRLMAEKYKLQQKINEIEEKLRKAK